MSDPVRHQRSGMIPGRFSTILLFVLASLPSALQGQEADEQTRLVKDPPWSQPREGLAYRLRAERGVWQSWEQPRVSLEVRNESDAVVPAKAIAARTLNSERGLMLMQGPPVVPPERHTELRVNIEFDSAVWRDLTPDQTLSIPLTIVSLWQSPRPGVDQPALLPDHIEVGLAQARGGEPPDFFSNLLPLHILPPGVSAAQDLDKWIRPYDYNGQPILAGFIPSTTRWVEGERLELVFFLANAGNENIRFMFGGDYRAANRHNRFKIMVHDESGELLPDPGKAFGDMGGITWAREISPGRTTTDLVELQKYRKLKGPGTYRVSAKFELATDFAERDKIAVETSFTLEVLPRTPENVNAVLERMLRRVPDSSGEKLTELIGEIAEFGKSEAVAGLADYVRDRPDAVRQAAIAGLAKIPSPESLEVLLSVEPDPVVRRAALLALGEFDDPQALARVVAAIDDSDEAMKRAAVDALGRMKSAGALDALLKAFRSARSAGDTAALLSAMGASGSDRVFETVAQALGNGEPVIREAALSAIVQFDPTRAGEALRRHVEDDDLDFREKVIAAIAEVLRQPIDPVWLVPVLQSRNGRNTLGDAPRMIRIYGGEKAAPTLLRCLDMTNPSIRSYYNRVIMQDQLACSTGLAIPWISDLNRNGTAEEIGRNRDILRRIARWLKEYDAAPWSEPPAAWHLPHDQQDKVWGPPVDGVRINARTNTSVWPGGLPQVVIVQAQKKGGSLHFAEFPKVVELEVDGKWYRHEPDVDMNVVGPWRHYKGDAFHSFQLTSHWSTIEGGQLLQLEEGEHSVRVRLVVPPETDRGKMVVSRPVKFRVLSDD